MTGQDDGTVRCIAERSSDPVQALRQRPSVEVAYAGHGAWVSLIGAALEVHDEEKLRHLWDAGTGPRPDRAAPARACPGAR